ncbi:unnamed protein product [Blepharisma stoltei]|uniref:Uncharacterized protein n=1 Tax=Blepharisma stoltei TaxID=1481888 RepID=A0AAU9IV57_9CILI|nr:unnamed protein product [Blepharisma stoltei]
MLTNCNSMQSMSRSAGYVFNIGLPRNFADLILNFEIELDFSITVEKVSRLMELYTKAIEYYEAVGDLKFIHYSERLRKLMTRPEVLNLFHQKPKIIEKAPEVKINLVKQEENHKVKRPQSAKHRPVLVKKTTDAITSHSNETSLTSIRIKENIKTQEGDSLEKRLEERRRNTVTHPKRRYSNPQQQPTNIQNIHILEKK